MDEQQESMAKAMEAIQKNQLTEERVVELIMAKAAEFQTKEEKIIETTWMQWFGNAFRFVVV